MRPSQSFPLLTAVGVLFTGTIDADASEWSHILGPSLDRKTTEGTATWSTGHPRKLWQIPAEGGFSSFVTGDGRAYTVIASKVGGSTRETAVAVDRKTGRMLWQVPLGEAGYRNGGERGVDGNRGGDGPRATPVFSGGRVLVFGGKFDLYALESATGKVIWKRDLLKEFNGSPITWSNAASPLIIGDRVLVAGGGSDQSFLAFRLTDGEVLWKRGTDRPTYSTPVFATIHGMGQAIFLVERGLVALDPTNGRELWHYPFPYRTATAASPVVWQDIVNCTAGYGVGGAACQITRTGETWSAAELWRSPGNRDTAAHWSTAVVHDGYLYGCYGHGEYGTGAFKCIDIRTGKVQWQQAGFGHGQVIMAGRQLLATTDAGRLDMIDPTQSAYRDRAHAQVIAGKVWARPAVSEGQLFLRSTKQGVCLEL
jgi:outer membrane protein assembly factor BamB